MRKAAYLYLLTFISPVLGLAQGAVDGYMNGRDITDIALTYSFERYNQYFFGNERQAAENTIQTLNLYVDHGFSDSLELVASIPYIWTDSLNRSLQDGVFMLKYRNKREYYERGALSLITAVGLSLPLAKYPLDTERPIGSRSTIIQARFLGQFEFKTGYFLMVKSGVDVRVVPIQQTAVPVLLKVGYGGAQIYADFWTELYQTFSARADTRIGGGEGSSWLRVGGTLYRPVSPQFGVFLGFAQFITGKNIGQATRVNAGVVYKLVPNR